MEQLIPIISQVGFPIVVTLYLLYRIESKLDMVVYLDTESSRPHEGTNVNLRRPLSKMARVVCSYLPNARFVGGFGHLRPPLCYRSPDENGVSVT